MVQPSNRRVVTEAALATAIAGLSTGGGGNGASAYQIWLAAGNTGTQAEFLASLKGSGIYIDTDGTPYYSDLATGGEGGGGGGNGDSAYDIWIGLGNTGTEQDFINSLEGADGLSGTAITVDGVRLNEVDFDTTPITADKISAMTYVGRFGALVTDTATVRPSVLGPVYWMCATGIDPVNKRQGDLVFTASA